MNLTLLLESCKRRNFLPFYKCQIKLVEFEFEFHAKLDGLSFPLQLVPAIRAYLSEQEVLLSLPLSLLPLFLLLGIRRLLLDDHPT